MLRKLDSRWALIQENETDLIFVDENEIIYPRPINVVKAGLVDFFRFSSQDCKNDVERQKNAMQLLMIGKDSYRTQTSNSATPRTSRDTVR